jgi:hypothetical protein
MTAAAGFAAVLAIGESTMRRMVRVLYITNKIKHAVGIDVPIPGFGRLRGTLFVGLPSLRFVDAGDDRVTLDLHLWGRVRTPLPMTVEVTGQVTAPMRVRLVTAGGAPVLRLGIRGQAASLSRPTLVTDPPLPPAIRAQLTPAALTQLLQPVIREQLGSQSTAPIKLDLLGGLTRADLSAKARVRDDVLLIGIDTTWAGPRRPSSISTSGDPDALRDIRRDGDVAVFVPGEQLPAVFADVERRIRRMVAQRRATLDVLTLRPVRGAMHVHVEAHDDDGATTFDFDVVPVLTVDPRDDRKERVRFEPRNVEVSVDASLRNKVIAGIVGVFTFGWAGIRAQELADAMRASIASSIREGGTDAGPRTTWFTLPGTTSPLIKLRVQAYTIAPSGSRVQVALNPLLPKPRLLEVSRLWADEAGTHVQTFAVVAYPPDVLPDDPRLRVRWELVREDTGVVVARGSERRFRADVVIPGGPAAVPVALTCAVRRRLATGDQLLYRARLSLRRSTTISNDRPFVRWVHHSVVQWVRKNADGSLTRDDLVTLPRASTIHRTDVPGGCLFVEPPGESTGSIDYTYLDSLPFPVEEIADHRDEVCDYCFFGGPTSTEPLPLPARAAGGR